MDLSTVTILAAEVAVILSTVTILAAGVAVMFLILRLGRPTSKPPKWQ